MYSTLLFLHFVGVSIGAGTGIYMLSLTRHAAQNMDQAEARTLMPGIAASVSRVGNIGLALLLLSGVGMGLMLGEDILSTMFLLKMLLVLLIVIFVVVMQYLATQVKTSDDKSILLLMRRLGMLGPLLGLATILVAVLVFH